LRLTVQPSLQLETSEEGYTLTTLRSEPTEIFVRGSSTALAALGDTVFTEPISLAGRTSDFEIEVPLDLRNDVIVLPSNERTVTVYVGIEAQMGVLQLDGIAVEFLGLGAGYELEAATNTISVVINGPRILLDDLTSEDVHAVVDLSGLEPGPYDVQPQVNLTRGQSTIESIISLPETLDITIIAEGTPQATPQPTSEAGEDAEEAPATGTSTSDEG
jgi:YbbR domain-containing protein